MPYSGTQMAKAPMKPSPSLIYNNLTLCGGNLLYAHIRQACAFPVGDVGGSNSPVQVRKIDSQHADVIHSVVACSHNAATFLVIATDAGLQIWDKTITHLTHVCPLPSAGASEVAARNAYFARGVAINVANDGTPHIAFGTSGGAVFALALSESDGKFGSVPVALPRHHKSPITAIGSAYQSRQGKWTEDLGCNLVTCDEEGGIAVWQAQHSGAGGFSLLTSIKPTGQPAVSVAVRRDLIVAARLDGAVQLYGLRDGLLRADLGAHSRFISAMDIHPTKDIIATVSEDCSLGVWALPIGGAKAECLLSTCWMNAMLTGVAFCGPTNDDVAVVAYDTDEVHVYKYS
ncbi:WD repeat-containing protein 54 [Pleodorina starrii]|uniref:WD repeat-containing protein 54 n=1 Tax=Pleodorina starrii TaxID=330485 RepID=A0A9W6BXJ7_9CHLO|nr:WD repeat-containing protein 54 [Pleodorina starrii]GLC59677.1 WD repeat-containing protein 54 [Pleodorina starrii]GLC74642.1 WD repeat-containing protein 54 [Pleodorina starrii]